MRREPISAAPETADSIVWEIRLPVLTNLFLWYDLAKVFVIVYIVVVTLMSAIFLVAGEAAGIPSVAFVFAIVCGALLAASIPIAAIWYANRVNVRYTLSPKGVRYDTLERKDRWLNRALVVLGLAMGKPAAAGAGLIAASRETELTRWKDVTRIKEHRSLAVLSLLDGWHVVQRLHCSREDYERVAGYVREHATLPRDSI